MHSKTLALFALTASTVLASPFHRRQDAAHHHRHHGTGTGHVSGIRPSGSGSPFGPGNDTNGFFAPTVTNTQLATLVITQTVSPLPETTSSCTTTSLVTETSTNMVTVTATPEANTKVAESNGNSVSPGAFYGGQGSRPAWGQSQGGATTGGHTPQPSAANPSTTFATATRSAVPSASAPASGGGSSAGKRGISFNQAGLVSAFSGAVSWAYNWASSESGSLGGVEYVPMLWGQNDISSFASKIGSATHVLSFNEPDLAEQANIPAAQAASLHKQVFSSLKGKVQIGSPAVTNGVKNPDGSPMGVNYLDSFFTACGGSCPVDFVAYHWYAGADNFAYFQQHTEDIIAVAAKYGVSKVWLTEFQPSGSADAQASFMKQAVQYLDSNPSVERYAAFMASDGTLLSGSSLNTVGRAYAGM